MPHRQEGETQANPCCLTDGLGEYVAYLYALFGPQDSLLQTHSDCSSASLRAGMHRVKLREHEALGRVEASINLLNALE